MRGRPGQVTVQQAIDECTQDRRLVVPVRVVDEQPWPCDRPVGEHLHELPLSEVLIDALTVEGIGNAQALLCGGDADLRVVGDQGPGRRHLDPPAPFLERPLVGPAVGLQPPVDAGVVMQVGG